MRRMAAGANRTGLLIIGLLLLLGGTFVALLGLGLLTSLLPGLDPSAGLGPIAEKFALPFSGLVAVVVAVILAIIGIWWLSLQIPRKDAAKPLRLQQDARTGITSVTAGVIAEAVTDDLESTPEVDDAQVILRGTARRPELVIHVDVGERADIDAVVADIGHRVGRNVSEALGVPLAAVGLEIGISRTAHRKQRAVTLPLQ